MRKTKPLETENDFLKSFICLFVRLRNGIFCEKNSQFRQTYMHILFMRLDGWLIKMNVKNNNCLCLLRKAEFTVIYTAISKMLESLEK